MNHLNLLIELMPFDSFRGFYYTRSNSTCVSSDGDICLIPDFSIRIPSEPKLLISPLNGNMIYFTTRLISTGSQSTDEDPNIILACFKNGENIHYIPDELIINNFLLPRSLDFQFIDDAAEIYELPEDLCLEMKSMIDKENTFKSWKRIVKLLEKKHFDVDLYIILSLRVYQKSITATLKDRINSLLTFVEFSNLVVLQIMYEIDNPSQADILTNNFCQKNGIDYGLVQYQESVRKYFDRMLPMPLNFISNIEKDKELNNFFLDSASEYEQHPNREVIFPDRSKQKAYMQRIPRSEKIRRLLFPSYYRTISLLYPFWDRLQTEHPELNREILNQNKLNQERDKINTQLHIQGSNPLDERGSALHQCQVCNLYSMMELKRGQNEPSQHCGRPQCKNTYGTWIKQMNRKGYNLRDRADES